MKDTIGPVLEKLTGGVIAGVIVLLFGAALAIGAAAGGAPQYGLAVPEQAWRVFLGALGVALGFAGLYLILREKAATNPPIDVSKLGIKITHAHQLPANPSRVRITGTCKGIPKGYDLWLINADSSGRKRYWPTAQIFVKDNKWTVQHELKGWKEGHERHYIVYLVGRDGKSLLEYYRSAGDIIEQMLRHFKLVYPPFELREDSPGRHWPALTDLTSDMFEIDVFRLRLEGSSAGLLPRSGQVAAAS